MVCAISKSKLKQLSLCVIPWRVLKTDLREWANVLGWLLLGILDFKYSPFIPLYFHMSSCTQTGTNSVLSKVFSCIHVWLLLSLLVNPCLSLPLSLCDLYHSLILSMYCFSLSLFCAQSQTKASYVGMHVQQIYRWLCDSRYELLEQLHSSLIRWHTGANQNHNSLFLTSCSDPWGKGKFSEKGPFYVIWVSPLVSQITTESESYSEFLYSSSGSTHIGVTIITTLVFPVYLKCWLSCFLFYLSLPYQACFL